MARGKKKVDEKIDIENVKDWDSAEVMQDKVIEQVEESKNNIKEAISSIQLVEDGAELEPLDEKVNIGFDQVLSTGSTTLDLAISSNRIYGGGIPGNIFMEIYGPSGSGKTSVLSEICGSAQLNGGDAKFLDPEARLDEEYSRIYGHTLKKDLYARPDTVTELFEHIINYNTDPSHISVIAADSLAALSTNMEMEDSDKRGQRRAKEFSEGLRKTARLIGKRNQILVCSNQMRQGEFGKVTPGGFAVPYYASLRIEMRQLSKIEAKKKIGDGATVTRVIGIESACKITKSSIDVPYREVPVYILFNLGIDDVRGNLQWLKTIKSSSKYIAVDKEYMSMNAAINYIEENEKEDELRKIVIDTWNEVEEQFSTKRNKKRR